MKLAEELEADAVRYPEERGELLLEAADSAVKERYCGAVPGDETIAWPPPRNAACWCGSGVKYKKCCGRPG